jgi:hypothetical protein
MGMDTPDEMELLFTESYLNRDNLDELAAPFIGV